MSLTCIANCIICGRCARAAILDEFHTKSKSHTFRAGYGVAVDIGTTTVVFALVDLATGEGVARHSFMNPQRAFGADVISRIDAAEKGHLEELTCLITAKISEELALLLTAADVAPERVIDMVIGCNTVMSYLLLGLPCKSLGLAPYKPAYNLNPPYKSRSLFKRSNIDCPVRIIPWMGAYVGGDVTAGLVYLLPEEKYPFLLMDLGTNGELALYNNGQLTVTATAAGPAFEQPVMASEELFQGASAVISALANLLREGGMNRKGLLKTEGTFTQRQIRDIQLAKSAIRAGLEILLEQDGLRFDDIEAVYLAGGIGQAVNVRDAIELKIMPPELEEKAFPVGNACLGGAVAFLQRPEQAQVDMDMLLADVKEINLAALPRFSEYFIDYMFF